MTTPPRLGRSAPTLPLIEGLVDLCMQLGVSLSELSEPERRLVDRSHAASDAHRPWYDADDVAGVRHRIERGEDALGDIFVSLVAPEDRRPLGQTYTPAPIIASMVRWALAHGTPARVIDPGSGSGRYALASARAFPDATVIAADIDPVATLMTRAAVGVLRLNDRVSVVNGDYRALNVPEIDGRTLFLGNPPYVRHHQIAPEWKAWLLETASKRGLAASGLAGLHVHFFLATAEHARPGDFGAFITSSEWMDVNYGQLVRELLLGDLGGLSLHVLAPEAMPFADATVTGAITCFEVGAHPETIRVHQVDSIGELGNLSEGHDISRVRLAEINRWSVLTRVTPKLPEGYIELGELVRVHRGAVTGANKVWVHSRSDVDLPDAVLYRSVTKARELFLAGERLFDDAGLKVVVDLPVDLDLFELTERKRIDRFLRTAKSKQVDQGYVASSRRAWYSVGLREPAPVLATYMARRPPAFVRNDVGARHINIAHGLYPRQQISDTQLDLLAKYLRTAVTLGQGRTYAGGLTKFEPREMERIPVPTLEALAQGA